MVESFLKIANFSEIQWSIISTLLNCKALVKFIREIASRDVRILADAVEEHSEQFVDTSMIASFIDVNQFLQRLISCKSSAEYFLEDLRRCFDIGISDVQTKLVGCSQCCSNLEALYRTVTNKGEITKEIVHNILSQGEYLFEAKDEEAAITVKAYYLDKQGKHTEHNIMALNDVKERACILTSEGSNNSTKISTRSWILNQDDINNFVEQVDYANEISNLLCILRQKGHFDYQTVKKKLTSVKLAEWKNILDDDLRKWNSTLEIERISNPLLNFIFSEQLWHLYDDPIKKGANILRFVNRDVILKNLRVINWKESPCNTQEKLIHLANLLTSVLSSELHHPEIKIDEDEATIVDAEVKKSKIYVASLNSDSRNVVPLILALYRNTTGYLPLAHEIMICDKQTTLEEIQMFLNRCLNSNSVLHCLACIEELDLELQYELTKALSQIQNNENSNEKKSLFRLAVIVRSRERSHPVIQSLQKYVHSPCYENNKVLKQILQNLPVKVRVITSDLPGQGKTEYIRTKAANEEIENAKEIKTLPIYDSDSKTDIVKRLNSLQLKRYQCLHLDVKCEWSSFLDCLIFELVTVRCLRSSTTIFHLDNDISYIFVEIANVPSDAKTIGFAISMYPSKHIKWNNYDDMVISTDVESDVQIVCNYLVAYYTDFVDKKGVTKGKLIDRYIVSYEILNSTKCKEYLRKTFNQKDMSFVLVNTFISVLATQLRKFSQSQYFNPSTLKTTVGKEKAATIRAMVLSALIDCAKDFATRSIETSKKLQLKSFLGNNADTINVNRTQGIVSWQDMHKAVVLFHSSDSQTLSILYRLKEHVTENLQNLFELQMFGNIKQKDNISIFNSSPNAINSNNSLPILQQLTHTELKERLERIVAPPFKLCSMKSNLSATDSVQYALTTDNVLKMVLIAVRIQANVPVVLMGETGCGKTSLIRYLAQCCNASLHEVSIHAGYTMNRLFSELSKLNKLAKEYLEKPDKEYLAEFWIFMDEINTCNHMTFLSDFICRRQLFGKNISPNIRIIAACNPYRLRSGKKIKTPGITITFNKENDIFAKLAYKVYPLPENLLDYIWDYGSLTEEDEAAYVEKMISNDFNKTEDLDLHVSLLTISQQCMRKLEDNSYCVSLRDIYRAQMLSKWFEKYMTSKDLKNDKYMPILLALGHCYMSRLALQSHRKVYLDELSGCFKTANVDLSSATILNLLRNKQDFILSHMILSEGIAKNTALRENVFVLMTYILNRIPVFLVGKPGCSKSLSMQLIRNNLRGSDADNVYFHQFPQLYVVSFQGAETSTSDGIEKVFEKAKRYREHTDINAVLPVVLLDEVGLAENSRFNPLKVLHSLLEPPGRGTPDVAVVGISNWALDAAKMNRAIYLARTDPSEEELIDTAKAIANDTSLNLGIPVSETLLEKLAQAYHKYINLQRQKDFHGLRDYYCLIKYVVKHLNKNNSDVPDVIYRGILRNFGGLTTSINDIIKTFSDKLNEKFASNVLSWTLIEENLLDFSSRHLMVISHGDAAIDGLRTLLERQKKPFYIIYGSTFEDDKVDEYNCRILSKIILYAERDMVLILKNLESVYGSLYDLLNQNYSKFGTKSYCRIALGPYNNPMCQVDENFRCVVVIDEQKLLKTDPPFLNRFEKQRLDLEHMKNATVRQLEKDINEWFSDICHDTENNLIATIADDGIIFQSPELITSLALKIGLDSNDDESNKLKMAINEILWLITPETMLQASTSKFAKQNNQEFNDLFDTYLKLPLFDGLNFLINYVLDNSDCIHKKTFPGTIIFTHNAWSTNAVTESTQIENLSSFKSRKSLEKRLEAFWLESDASVLIIYCKWPQDAEHYLLVKSLIETVVKDNSCDSNITKHVMLLVQLNRKKEKTGYPPCSYLWGWKLITLDSINLPPHMPRLPEFISCNFLNFLRSNVKDSDETVINRIVADLWPTMFSQITYQPSSIRKMHTIKNTIDCVCENQWFIEIISKYILQMFERNFKLATGKKSITTTTMELWLHAIATDHQKMVTCSTFLEAVNDVVEEKLSELLVKIVYAFEMYSSWPSFSQLEPIKNFALWKDFLTDVIKQFKNDSKFLQCNVNVLELEFQFSKYFIEKFDRFQNVAKHEREKVSSLAGSNNDAECRSQLLNSVYNKCKQSIFDRILSDTGWNDVLLQYGAQYVRDFCRIKSQQLVININEKDRIAWLTFLLRGKLLETGFVFKAEHFPTLFHVVWWLNIDFFTSFMRLITMLKKLQSLDSEVINEESTDIFWINWFKNSNPALDSFEETDSICSDITILPCDDINQPLERAFAVEANALSSSCYSMLTNATLSSLTQKNVDMLNSYSGSEIEIIPETGINSPKNYSKTVSLENNESNNTNHKQNLLFYLSDNNTHCDIDFKNEVTTASDINTSELQKKDFTATALLRLLEPLADENKLCATNSRHLVSLMFAAAIRVIKNHPILDFFDIILQILSLFDGSRQLKNINLKDFIENCKETRFIFTEKCFSSLENLLDQLLQCVNNTQCLRVTLINFLTVLYSNNGMTLRDRIIQKTLILVSNACNTSNIRSILFHLMDTCDLINDSNLHDILYDREYCVDFHKYEKMFCDCPQQTQLELWMLLLQILNINCFKTISQTDLSCLSTDHEFFGVIKQALIILIEPECINFQRLVSIRILRAFLDAVSVCICKVTELEKGNFDTLLTTINMLCNVHVGSDNKTTAIVEILLIYLLKMIRYCNDPKSWANIYSLLKKKMPCIDSLKVLQNKSLELPWFPLQQAFDYCYFIQYTRCEAMQSQAYNQNVKIRFNSDNQIQNYVDFMVSICLLQVTEASEVEISHAIVKSASHLPALVTDLLQTIESKSFKCPMMNIKLETNYNTLLQDSLVLETIKWYCIKLHKNETVEGCLFERALSGNIIKFNNKQEIRKEILFYICPSCKHRLGTKSSSLKKCSVCEEKLAQKNQPFKRVFEETDNNLNVAIKILDVISYAAFIAGLSIGHCQANINNTETLYRKTWQNVLEIFPENDEFICQILHLIIQETLHLTCQVNVLKDANWQSKFTDECKQLLINRYELLFGVQKQAQKSRPDFMYDYWEAKLLEIDADYVISDVSTDNVNLCSHLFGLQVRPTKHHFELSFNLTSGDSYPFLFEVIKRQEELEMIKFLLHIWEWHKLVCSLCSYEFFKQEVQEKNLRFLFERYKDLSLPFLKLQSTLIKLKTKFNVLQAEVKTLTENSLICDALMVNENSELFKILVILINIQNKFLDDIACMSSDTKCASLEYIKWDHNTSIVPTIDIVQVDSVALIDYEWSDDKYLIYSQNNTSYGRGREIFYDYDTIESLLARRLLFGKPYIFLDATMFFFHFKDEKMIPGRAIITDVKLICKQEKLSGEQKRKLSKYDGRQLQQHQIMVSYLVWILKQEGGQENDTIREYLKKWETFLPKGTVSGCQSLDESLQLKHIAALFQNVEFLLSQQDLFESDAQKYKAPLGVMSEIITKAFKEPKVPLNDILEALHRLLFRLTSRHTTTINEADLLRDYLNDVTLWEDYITEDATTSASDATGIR